MNISEEFIRIILIYGLILSVLNVIITILIKYIRYKIEVEENE